MLKFGRYLQTIYFDQEQKLTLNKVYKKHEMTKNGNLRRRYFLMNCRQAIWIINSNVPNTGGETLVRECDLNKASTDSGEEKISVSQITQHSVQQNAFNCFHIFHITISCKSIQHDSIPHGLIRDSYQSNISQNN